jgi:ribosome maturation factor RimP
MTPQEQIAQYIDEAIEGTDCFLVSFKLKPTNNYKIYIDSDSGFTLEKAMKINRKLRKQVDESGMYPEGEYSLEVSSPGIEVPLTMPRQYVKNIGRKLEIILQDEAAKGITGKLLEVSETDITIERVAPLKKSKKEVEEEMKPIKIELADIKQAVVCIEF